MTCGGPVFQDVLPFLRIRSDNYSNVIFVRKAIFLRPTFTQKYLAQSSLLPFHCPDVASGELFSFLTLFRISCRQYAVMARKFLLYGCGYLALSGEVEVF